MTKRRSSTTYWLYFVMWLGILALFLTFYPQFLWMALPGIVTNFTLALDIM
ncbi:MAG: hypothetical protein ABI405_08660 [Parafilimonas sp.]